MPPDPALLVELITLIRSAAKIPPEVPIDGDSLLVEDLAIDSLDMVGVILKLQIHYGVTVEDDDVMRLRRVSDLAAFVSRHRGAAAA